MKKIKTFLLITLALFCFSGTAYAKCQIQYTGKAARMFGSAPRGNFATKKECLDYWRSRPAFERNHSKCVGCVEQNSSQTQQVRRRRRFQDNNIRQKKLNKTSEFKAKRQQMIRQQQQKEEQSRAEFYQGKKKMLTQLKGGSGGEGLNLKGSGGALALKSAQAPAQNHGSVRDDQSQQADQRLTELRDDVKTMQFALQVYRDGLLQNVTSLDRQSREIGNMSDKILMDGIKYFRSIAPSRFLKSKFKFMSKGQQKKYEDFIELVEKLKQLKDEKESLSWLVNSPNDTKKLHEALHC